MLWDSFRGGDAIDAPYRENELSLLYEVLYNMDNELGGVIFTRHITYFNNLYLQASVAAGIYYLTMYSGVALVDGTLYTSNSAFSIYQSTTPFDKNPYYIFLQKNKTTQTVRAIFKRTQDVVQNDTLHEILLYKFIDFNASGTYYYYDYRKFIGGIVAYATNTATTDFVVYDNVIVFTGRLQLDFVAAANASACADVSSYIRDAVVDVLGAEKFVYKSYFLLKYVGTIEGDSADLNRYSLYADPVSSAIGDSICFFAKTYSGVVTDTIFVYWMAFYVVSLDPD
jgi:hypothetical protein